MTTDWTHFSNPLQSNPSGPSVKTLQALGIAAPEARELKEAIRTADSHDDVDRALDLADKQMRSFGVESIEGNWVDRYYQTAVALYVNTGDTYNTTLLYETDTGRFLVTSWGDWVEHNTRKYGIE